MNYSPKHNDIKMRAIYGGLVILSFVFMNVGTGAVNAVCRAVSVLCLVLGIYLFIRYDLTTYTYIVMDNGDRLDFYINRTTGKRGSYVCYYALNDIVSVEDYKKGTKKEIEQKYGKTFFYNYCHNRFALSRQVIVFKNTGYHDAVIVELSPECVAYLKSHVKQTEEN